MSTEEAPKVEITVENVPPSAPGSLRASLRDLTGLSGDLSTDVDFGICAQCGVKRDFIGCPNVDNHAIRDEEIPEMALPVFDGTKRHFKPHTTIVIRKRRWFIGRWFAGCQRTYVWQCVECDAVGQPYADKMRAHSEGHQHEVTV